MDKNSKLQLLLLVVSMLLMATGVVLFLYLPAGSVVPLFPTVASIGGLLCISKLQETKP